MSSRQILLDQLSVLRMPSFRQALEEQLSTPHYDELPFEERLTLLLEQECAKREHNRIQRRIRQARFQQSAWVQDLDFSAKRGLQRSQVLQLAQTTWITKGLNLIILGPTGSGKSFLACALGRSACQHDLIVRYFRLPRFFQAVKTSQLEGEYPRFLKSLSKAHLLILDDWLRDPLTLTEAQTLLDVLDDRYGLRSTLLATQFPVSTWHARLPDPTLADAILDRLVHNAHRIELQGESQRKLRAESAMSST